MGCERQKPQKMQTLRVLGRDDSWIELMPVERFAREGDTRPELSLCFARMHDDERRLWVTNGELILGKVVDCDGAPVGHCGMFSRRDPPLLMDAFLRVKGLPNKRSANLCTTQPEWPRHMSLETVARIEGAPTPQLGVVLRMAFPPPVTPWASARFEPRAQAAGAPAFLEFAFSLFSAP